MSESDQEERFARQGGEALALDEDFDDGDEDEEPDDDDEEGEELNYQQQ